MPYIEQKHREIIKPSVDALCEYGRKHLNNTDIRDALFVYTGTIIGYELIDPQFNLWEMIGEGWVPGPSIPLETPDDLLNFCKLLAKIAEDVYSIEDLKEERGYYLCLAGFYNYILTLLVKDWFVKDFDENLKMRYADGNSAMECFDDIRDSLSAKPWPRQAEHRIVKRLRGAVRSSQFEFYRRKLAPYEDGKIDTDGDVY